MSFGAWYGGQYISRRVERERCTSKCCDCSATISWWYYWSRKRVHLVRCSDCTAELWHRKLQAIANGAGETRH